MVELVGKDWLEFESLRFRGSCINGVSLPTDLRLDDPTIVDDL